MDHRQSPPNGRPISPYIWSFSTYFTEGFPYTIIRTVSSVFFRDLGMSLEGIGLTSLFGLPWIIKFFWGPQVDEFETKRRWLLVMQGVLALLFLATAFLVPLDSAVPAIATLFFAGSFVAATHDIAIDGYYMEALDEDGQARFVGYRVMAYRIAMMTGTGVIVTIGTTVGWFAAFLGAGLLLTAFFLFHWRWLPRCEEPGKPVALLLRSLARWRFVGGAGALAGLVAALRLMLDSEWYAALQEAAPILKRFTFAAWIGVLLFAALMLVALFRRRLKALICRDPDSFYARAFVSFTDREKIGVIIAFIILIRTGEFMLSAMAAPFMVDLGIKMHYGWISGGVGLPASIVGAMLGGWLIGRYGLKRMIWPFLWAQNLTNLVYMVLALILSHFLSVNTGAAQPVPIGAVNLAAVVGVHAFDQFAGGLGTAVLMTYLMRICRPDFKAAHYAIGTGLMSVSGLYAGVLSGFLASWLGYGLFFGVSFVMALPGMLLVPFVPLGDHVGRRR